MMPEREKKWIALDQKTIEHASKDSIKEIYRIAFTQMRRHNSVICFLNVLKDINYVTNYMYFNIFLIYLPTLMDTNF